VHVAVANTGSAAGDLVVPVYVSQPVSPVLVPAKRLAGFARVSLPAGAQKTITVKIPTSALGIVPGDVNASGPPSLQPGQYVFSAGDILAKVTPDKTNSITL
jgi:beta-glucosidase